MSAQILIGVIISAHGIKGQVKIKAFSDNPKSFSNYRLQDHSGNIVKCSITSVNGQNIAIATIKDVTTRNEAEELKGLKLFIDRNQLANLPENQFYIQDLIGLDIVDPKGLKIGKITNILNFGAGDIVEYADNHNSKHLIAFTNENFPVVDLEKNFIKLNKK